MSIVDVMEQAFVRRAGGWSLILPEVFREAWLDREFADLVRNSDAYHTMVKAGVDGEVLIGICTVFHVIERWRQGTIAKLARMRRIKLMGPRQYVRGRRYDQFPAFQIHCDELVGQREDGRRFYAEFTELMALVYGRHISVKSYCRRLKAARLKLRQTPTPTLASMPSPQDQRKPLSLPSGFKTAETPQVR